MNKTLQRQVILEELCKVTCHPTADELYAIVRERMPQISLGTVYRNLEQLSEHGIIQKIETAGRQKRFDGNAAPHHHFRCNHCGGVQDIMHKELALLDQCLEQMVKKVGAIGVMVEFYGCCTACEGNQATPV